MDPDEEASFAEYDGPSELRDAIAEAMWEEYMAVLEEHNMDIQVDWTYSYRLYICSRIMFQFSLNMQLCI